jgi:hydrogenase nickel incorporation protein HypA/HybF
MHELSIVSSIVERVLEFLDGHEAKRVVALRLAIGELTCVDAEQLRSCYELVTEGTVIAGSELEIEQTKALVRCSNCNFHGAPKYWDDALSRISIPTLQCPGCGLGVEAIEGHECAIQGIRYVA